MHVLEADVDFLADGERHGVDVAAPLRTASIVNVGAPGRCALASVSIGVHLEAQPLARAART